jgi:chromosome segregation ATPase
LPCETEHQCEVRSLRTDLATAIAQRDGATIRANGVEERMLALHARTERAEAQYNGSQRALTEAMNELTQAREENARLRTVVKAARAALAQYDSPSETWAPSDGVEAANRLRAALDAAKDDT